jgi:poly(A) polymerase
LLTTEEQLVIYNAFDKSITVNKISKYAVSIIRTLQSKDFSAYVVGGAVRDLIIGLKPKDFDIVTDAKPYEIKTMFPKSQVIGRRFQLVHVKKGGDFYEVSTFRSDVSKNYICKPDSPKKNNHKKYSTDDSEFGTIHEDAFRRDLTINALYYDPVKEQVYDFNGGIKDLLDKRITVIGPPEIRFTEDPVRILRIIRIAAKLNFQIPSDIEKHIYSKFHLIKDVSKSRLFDESLKMFLHGQGLASYELIRRFNGLKFLVHISKKNRINETSNQLFEAMLKSTDLRVKQKKYVSPHFLFAVLLWPNLLNHVSKLEKERSVVRKLMSISSKTVLAKQASIISIPKRYLFKIIDIWNLQIPLVERRKKDHQFLINHPCFRAAYDLILLRETIGEKLNDAGRWWTEYQNGNKCEQAKLLDEKAFNEKNYKLNTHFYE